MTKQKHIPSSNMNIQSSKNKMSDREYHKKVDKIFKQQVDMLCAIRKYTDAIGAIDAIKNNINNINNINNTNDINKININSKPVEELLYFLIQYQIIKTRMYALNTQIMDHNDKLLINKHIKYNDNADNADNADIIFDKLLNSINEFINDCNNLCKSSKIDLV